MSQNVGVIQHVGIIQTFPNLSLEFVHLHFIVVVGEADLRSKLCSD